MISIQKKEMLKELRKNSRTSFKKMSLTTGMPITTIFDNYHKFVRDNLIKKHTSLVDFKKLGYHYRSFVFVKAQDRDQILEYLQEHKNVNSVYSINGFDYCADVIFPSVKEYSNFIEELQEKNQGVEIEEHDVIEYVKKEGFMCL